MVGSILAGSTVVVIFVIGGSVVEGFAIDGSVVDACSALGCSAKLLVGCRLVKRSRTSDCRSCSSS